MSALARILLVDDDRLLLDGLRRQLRRDFSIETAVGGAEGLACIAAHGPFAVVLSDYQMPQMTGAAFLAAVRREAPDTTRMLLTGQADLAGAAAVVNEGGVFRFLLKPVDRDALLAALTAGVEQHRLVTAERELIERTLSGSVMAARAGGSGHRAMFDPSMKAAAEESLALRAALGNALAGSQFVLHYQPIVATGDGRLTGFEALLRWEHPDLGVLAPGRFIGEAEESGLIVPIGSWALEEACRALARAQEIDSSLTMSVNLSARQLEAEDVVDRVAAAVAAAGVAPATVCLELTESLFVDPGSPEAGRIDALAKLGVRLAIDDFGTGFSSLGYLRNFPVHTVKIDRSFVTDVDQGGSRQALVASIIGLCRALDLSTVAEGVETDAERETLVAIGCDRLQGYLFSRPVPEEEALDYALRARAAARLRA